MTMNPEHTNEELSSNDSDVIPGLTRNPENGTQTGAQDNKAPQAESQTPSEEAAIKPAENLDVSLTVPTPMAGNEIAVVQPDNQNAVSKMDAPGIFITAEGNKTFFVKLNVYDGPLDLLLELIKKNEMDICNIQIALVTQQYMDYLAGMKQLDLEIAGEFIVMAATLIYIKSRMLLPQTEEVDEEEGGDPRAELIRKLLEYQAFKEAAKELGMLEWERGKVFTRQVSDYYLSQMDAEDVEIDAFSANLFDLLSAFQKVLTKFGQEAIHEVFEQSISIEERIDDIHRKLSNRKKIVFSELFTAGFTRNYLIVTFLAILEIVRTKFARVQQDEQFGEIVIEKLDNVLIQS